jgi:AcrR family transcriptional regulator
MIHAMKDATLLPGRAYDNSHRAAQAAQTREAILDALVRVIARGVAELSMPAVAQEAGVSVRTVYRHFPTKRDLLSGLAWHLDERMSSYSVRPYPRDLDELAIHIRQYFRALDGMSDADRAIWASEIVRESREQAGLPEKFRIIESALQPVTGSLPEPDRTLLFNVATTIFSRFTLQRMKEDLGLSADDAADSVIWAIETLVRGATGGGAAAP